MPTTPIYGFPYPSNTALIRNGHDDITDLAIDVEDTYDVLNGLIPIIPTGTHTNITFDQYGVGTPTVGQTSFVIAGCFPSAYTATRIMWNGSSASASSTITVSFPGYTAGLYGNLLYNRPNATTPLSVNNNGLAQFTWIGWSGSTQTLDMTIFGAGQSSEPTFINGRYIEYVNLAGAAVGNYHGVQASTPAMTSIQITLSSGVIVNPGSVRIYAYNR